MIRFAVIMDSFFYTLNATTRIRYITILKFAYMSEFEPIVPCLGAKFIKYVHVYVLLLLK